MLEIEDGVADKTRFEYINEYYESIRPELIKKYPGYWFYFHHYFVPPEDLNNLKKYKYKIYAIQPYCDGHMYCYEIKFCRHIGFENAKSPVKEQKCYTKPFL